MCDLLDSETPGVHYMGDVRHLIDGEKWDLMIAHPPCTYLAVSGAAHFNRPERVQPQIDAIAFVRYLMNAPIPRIAIENPVSVISSRIRKPDQIVQPYQFGHGERKKTCLWLKNLPLLVPTDEVEGRSQSNRWVSPGPDRWKERSRTFTGIASAMAEQWG